MENFWCQVIKIISIILPDLSFSYLHYLDLCSRIVRASLKAEFKAAAMKRAEQGLKFAKWSEGKQSELSTFLIVETYSLTFLSCRTGCLSFVFIFWI